MQSEEIFQTIQFSQGHQRKRQKTMQHYPENLHEKHHSGKKLLSGYQRETLHVPHKLTRMRVSGKPSHLPSIDFVDHNNKL